jgi:hypothetical protein
MKKVMFLLAAVMAITFSTKAQVNVSVNIGNQPAWGPTGYDHVDYYYLPDIDCYYDVPNKVYVYPNGNSWVRSRNLPSKYKNFDFYNSHKVVINGVNRPYEHHDKYRQEYGGFKGKHDQTPIRDSKEEKYFESKGHPQHAQWTKDHPEARKGNKNNNNNRGGRGHR